MNTNTSTEGVKQTNQINKNEKLKVMNLAVFDLDGTLYKCNSHIEILNAKYKIKFFDSFFMKIVGKLYNSLYIKILTSAYNRIPKAFIRDFRIEFRKSALELFRKAQSDGFHVVIVSNAPKELIESAAMRLNTEWYRTEIGYKSHLIQSKFEYKNLLVCTDNVSDMNLLDIADQKYIFITKRTKKIFCEEYPSAHFMED